jgi:DNA-binding CsgD family transcriptional regulator
MPVGSGLSNRGNWERVRPATGISVTAGGPLAYARSRAIAEVKVINGSAPILSPREKRILLRLARGYSDRAIAVQIGGRPEQVGEQRKRLLQKLQISSQSEIAEAAAQWASWPSYKFTTAVDELHAWPNHRENGGCEPPS